MDRDDCQKAIKVPWDPIKQHHLHADPPGIPWSNYGPVIVHLQFPNLTESAFGSHPYRVVSVSYSQTMLFHGGNAGSNPAGDAIPLLDLQTSDCSKS